MNKKIVGIFVVTLLLVTTGITVAGTINKKNIFKEQQDQIVVDSYSSTIAQTPEIGTVTVRVLVRGAPIDGSNGVRVGPDGNLYIASAVGREIVVMNPKNGKILNRIGQDKGVESPDDLVFGPDGSLYWTDILTGEVGRLKPDGTYNKQYVAKFVNPIAFNDEGRLFVAQAFINDGLYEVDPNLIDPPQKILGVGNPALSLNAFDFGPDGLLYAPRSSLDQLVRINVDTGEVEVVTDEADGACKFDSNGELYTIAVGGTKVVKCDVNTGECTIIAEIEPKLDNLAFDVEDQLYVSNYIDGSIYNIKKNGEVKEISPGGLMAPGGIAVLPDGYAGESIFIADFWTIKEFDGLTGKPGLYGIEFFFDAPFTAAPDGENLILSSWFGNTVEIWDPEINDKLETYYFKVPLNAVRFQQDIVVAELGTGKVVRLDHITGIRETLASLYIPTGLAYTEDDLWVADWITGNIYQIVAEGIIQNPPIIVTSGLSKPEGMALNLDGNLLVVESGIGQLTCIDLETGEKIVMAKGLAIGETAPSGWPPTWLFNGVAIGEHGDIYVTGDVENVVYKIGVTPPNQILNLSSRLFERFPHAFPILRYLLGL